MKRFPVTILLLWMLSLVGCRARVHHRDLSQGRSSPAVLEELDELRAVLPGNLTAWYAWEAVFDSQVLALKESACTPRNGSSAEGRGCDTELWFVGASVQGTTDLTVSFRPLIEGQPPLRSATVKVVSMRPYHGTRNFTAAATEAPAPALQQSQAAANPTCGKGGKGGKAYQCPTNTTAKSTATVCSSLSCSQADCCTANPTCGKGGKAGKAYQCPANITAKSTTTVCSSLSCSQADCCALANPTCGKGGKGGKAYQCPTNTTAKSSTTVCSSLSCSQADCCAGLLGSWWNPWDWCGSVGTTFCLVNFAGRRITGTSVSEVDNYDWDGDSRPDHNMVGLSLADGESICKHMELNYCASSSWFRLTVIFEGGGSASMRLDQYWARDTHYGAVSGTFTVPGLTAFQHCGVDTQTLYLRGPEPDLSRWMGWAQTANPDVRLSDLVIPLTHDAGMAGTTACTLVGSFKPEATVTQTLDLGRQLRAGVRAFDLRPCVDMQRGVYRQEHLVWCHYNAVGLWILGTIHPGCDGLRVVGSLQQVLSFLQANPTETVLLEITHTMDNDRITSDDGLYNLAKDATKRLMIEAVTSILGPVLYKAPSNDRMNLGNLPLSTLAGKAVVAFQDYPESDIKPVSGLHGLHTCNDNNFRNTYGGIAVYDQYSNKDDPSPMTQDQISKFNRVSVGLGQENLFLVSWTLTSQGAGLMDIKAMSARCNAYLPGQIRWWQRWAKKPNLIGMDFIDPWMGRAIVGLNMLNRDASLGCWTDSGNRVLPYGAGGYGGGGSGFTPQTCIQKCRAGGYPIAGVEVDGECFCGNTYTALGPSTACTSPCAADRSKTCGGPWALAVSSAFSPGAAEVAHLGCYRDTEDRALPALMTYTTTPDHCISLCRAQGYAYAGLQYYGQCFCGNGNGYKRFGPSSSCNTPCTADPTQICGGAWANSVFAI